MKFLRINFNYNFFKERKIPLWKIVVVEKIKGGKGGILNFFQKRNICFVKHNFSTFLVIFFLLFYLNYSRRNLRKKSGGSTPKFSAVPPFWGRTGQTVWLRGKQKNMSTVEMMWSPSYQVLFISERWRSIFQKNWLIWHGMTHIYSYQDD